MSDSYAFKTWDKMTTEDRDWWEAYSIDNEGLPDTEDIRESCRNDGDRQMLDHLVNQYYEDCYKTFLENTQVPVR